MAAALTYGQDTFLSVFTWRYGSEEMRKIFSLRRKCVLQRDIWTAVATALCAAGVVTEEQVDDLEAQRDDIDIGAILAREDVIRHDVMAAIQIFVEQLSVGAPIVHLGMTSEDNTSNLDIIVMRAALEILIDSLEELIPLFADKIEEHAELRCCGYTHLQAATTTTVGYRLATYAQDLMQDLEQLRGLRSILLGKGLKGATGTRASFVKLLEDSEMTADELEQEFLRQLGLPDAFLVSGQVYPRKVDHTVLSALAGLAMSLHKFGFDVRLQQSTPFNELSEPFGKKQKGSSAMPWKKNPINSENIDSLARVVPAFAQVAWINAAFCGLDRTIDESAARRIIIPTSFLIMDEVLKRAKRVIKGLVVKKKVIERNLWNYGLFNGIENLLMHLVKNCGQDRDEMHEVLRLASMKAWEEVEEGDGNPLILTLHDGLVKHVGISQDEIESLLEEGAYAVGDAPERARKLAAKARALAAAT